MDRLVARRGDADPLAAREQVHDQPRAGPRLARPGRALHEEVAALDLVHEPLHLFERLALHPGAAERRLAPQQPLKVRVATDVVRQPNERRLLDTGVERPAGDERLRQRHVREDRPAPQRQRPRRVVERHDRPGTPPVAGS